MNVKKFYNLICSLISICYILSQKLGMKNFKEFENYHTSAKKTRGIKIKL